jgi:hypothetical protein
MNRNQEWKSLNQPALSLDLLLDLDDLQAEALDARLELSVAALFDDALTSQTCSQFNCTTFNG